MFFYDIYYASAKMIRNTSLEKLSDKNYLVSLIKHLGLHNCAALCTEPHYKSLQPYINRGLKISQIPEQLAEFLIHVGKLPISSYIEIGTRDGGNFILISEYIELFNGLQKCVAVDLTESTFSKSYNKIKKNKFSFLNINSKSNEFFSFVKQNSFDLCFIDGCHEYEYIKSDFNLMKDHCRFIAFHDINDYIQSDVVKFWKEVKVNYKSFEYTSGGTNKMGIGMICLR